jgi:hypothetical protein
MSVSVAIAAHAPRFNLVIQERVFGRGILSPNLRTTPLSAFDVRRSAFGVRRSMFGVRHSMFDVRRSAFDVEARDGRHACESLFLVLKPALPQDHVVRPTARHKV